MHSGKVREPRLIRYYSYLGTKDNLPAIMQLIDDPSLSCDDRLDLAFRYDADDARVKKGMELFNSYARGGIQWLYDEITQNAITSDDYYENISNLVKNFSQDYEEAFPKEED